MLASSGQFQVIEEFHHHRPITVRVKSGKRMLLYEILFTAQLGLRRSSQSLLAHTFPKVVCGPRVLPCPAITTRSLSDVLRSEVKPCATIVWVKVIWLPLGQVYQL